MDQMFGALLLFVTVWLYKHIPSSMSERDEFDDLEFDFSLEELDQIEARFREPEPSNISSQSLLRASRSTPPPTRAAAPSAAPLHPSEARAPTRASSSSDFDYDDEMLTDPSFLSALDEQLAQAERQSTRAFPDSISRLPFVSISGLASSSSG